MKTTVALCQMKVDSDKQENLARARGMIKEAKERGAQIVALPEMFNCPYDISCFSSYAETVPGGETSNMLSAAAREEGVYLIGGSIPELRNNAIYNTSLIYNSEGQLIGKYSKTHLFDVKVKDGIEFTESAVLKAGEEICLVDTPWGKLGVVICYDIRFPELTRLLAQAGARMVFVPAAFNMTTGPAHWETLFRSRAMDNQIFMLGTSPARDETASYTAYGHSLAVSPWGRVMGELEHKEGMLLVELDLQELETVREAIPVWRQRRTDLYSLAGL